MNQEAFANNEFSFIRENASLYKAAWKAQKSVLHLSTQDEQ
jgi:hypothetical protein